MTNDMKDEWLSRSRTCWAIVRAMKKLSDIDFCSAMRNEMIVRKQNFVELFARSIMIYCVSEYEWRMIVEMKDRKEISVELYAHHLNIIFHSHRLQKYLIKMEYIRVMSCSIIERIVRKTL